MDLISAMPFVRGHRNGILITLKGNGRPQSSNIVYAVGEDGRIRISMTAGRAKARNAVRDPRVSLHVNRDDFWAYVVVEGTAEFTPVTTDPHDSTADALVDLYRSLAGEHDDWDDYRAAMVKDGRLVMTIRVDDAYGMLGQG